MRYATSADGTSIAHAISGSGAHDVLEVGGYGALFSVESCNDLPHIQRFEQRLGRFGRLIRFDPRGLGSSDGAPDSVTLDAFVDDCIAVLDEARSEAAAVVATGYGGPAAIALAARAPERVSRLFLANTWAVASHPRLEARVESIDATIDAPSDLVAMAPSVASDALVQAWWERESRRGSSPAIVKAYWRFVRDTDVRSLAAGVACPVTVLVSEENRFGDPSGSEQLVALTGAKRQSIDVADHVLWAMPQSAVIAVIEEALTGAVTHAEGVGELLAIAFTDIVGSTARNTAEGDVAWSDKVLQHDEMTRRTTVSKGGTYVKSTGDGSLLIFPAPSAAIACATEIRDEAIALGIEVRAGIHVAEVQRHRDDVVGVGVALAARLLDHADPGAVVVSSAVRDALVGSAERFELIGPAELKGIPGVWDVHRVGF